MFQPVIKWSGSKRSQAKQIVDLFPKRIETYYEPFCGGCSVMRQLLNTIEAGGDIACKHLICSDLNEYLISLWQLIKSNPEVVADSYEKHWESLNKTDDKALKRTYFEQIRKEFNTSHKPTDFMFIMRTTTNGMPRFNQNGEFNNSFHITRDGIHPAKLRKIIIEWSFLLNKYNVEFKNGSYKDILRNVTANDFVYMDPPYANTKGMYFGRFNQQEFFQFVYELPSPWMLSYDGISGKIDNTFPVPETLYDKHYYIRSGNSSFKRTIGKSKIASSTKVYILNIDNIYRQH